ncbi:hypothetical protein J3B02_003708 [Coemansia erecta]|nr:hypothetical protein J3B02_003708 [Coemansia erecta]
MAQRLSQAASSSSNSSSKDTSRQPLLPSRPVVYQPPAQPQSLTATSKDICRESSERSSVDASPQGSIVLVRADGSGVCMDGSAHSWKQVYPPHLWCIACGCLLCCGPLYCFRHPQKHCRKCGIVIKHPVDT